FAPIEATTEEDFDTQFNTNVKGLFFTLQKMISHLAEGASVILTSSGASISAVASNVVYSATKAAVDTIGRVAATELADRDIRVNIVDPGPTSTPGFGKAIPEEAVKEVQKQFPLKRIGQPEEIADTVLFLASDKSSFITGAYLSVDGGLTLRR